MDLKEKTFALVTADRAYSAYPLARLNAVGMQRVFAYMGSRWKAK